MAKAKVGVAGIEYIQGAMAKPKKVNGHNHGNYLILTHRTAATTNPNCQRIYSFDADRYKRSTAPSQDEMIARARFAAVTQAVATRSQDLMQINADKQAFIAQKDQPGGKKTLKSWYWKVCGDAYDAEHPRS
jgi:hypothetical protein